jgi:hypothetical protein
MIRPADPRRGQTVMDLAVNGVPIGQPIKEVR